MSEALPGPSLVRDGELRGEVTSQDPPHLYRMPEAITIGLQAKGSVAEVFILEVAGQRPVAVAAGVETLVLLVVVALLLAAAAQVRVVQHRGGHDAPADPQLTLSL